MNTAIVYYSQHHGNTKKLLDAIASQEKITFINVVESECVDLSPFDCVGFASGIYFASFAKQVLNFAEKYLPEDKNVFFINTCGFQSSVYFDSIRKIASSKKCHGLGAYQCLGYDTFGPFKLVGGIAKHHPDENEIAAAVNFYQLIKSEQDKANTGV